MDERLHVVKSDEVAVIQLPPRQDRRMAALRAAFDAAQVVAQAAALSAQQIGNTYHTAITAALEAQGVDTSVELGVVHDSDRGTIEVGPKALMDARAAQARLQTGQALQP